MSWCSKLCTLFEQCFCFVLGTATNRLMEASSDQVDQYRWTDSCSVHSAQNWHLAFAIEHSSTHT